MHTHTSMYLDLIFFFLLSVNFIAYKADIAWINLNPDMRSNEVTFISTETDVVRY